MKEPIDPDDQAQQDAAREDAHAPIYAPAEWFMKAGRKGIADEGGLAAMEPFSFARRAAFQRISSGGSMESNAMLVFLCLMTRDAIDAARGPVMESRFRERMEGWADAIGVRFDKFIDGERIRNPAAARIGEIADAIWQREEAAEHSPVLPKATGKPASPNA